MVIVGSKVYPEWDLVPAPSDSRFHNLSGRTNLLALMAVLGKAACVITVDSGVAHLAAAFEVPALTFFGPDPPVVFGPVNPRGEILFKDLHCSPCVNLLEGKKSDCQDNVCIRTWSPEEVCDRAIQLMGRIAKER